jgi:hypothetical protein
MFISTGTINGQLTLSYVSASTFQPEFPFEPTEHGCTQFCRALKNYQSQQAMQTQLSIGKSFVDKCVCIYQDGMLPNANELPGYSTRSMPKFYLTSASGVLGVPEGHDCNAAEINIELQNRVNAFRQQFQLSYDNQLVNSACPSKVLTAKCATEQIMFKDINTGDPEQTWLLDTNVGSISSAKCPDLKVTSIKEAITSFKSNFFSFVSTKSGMVIGIEGAIDSSCVEGLNLVLQQAVPGSPSQQFYTEGNRFISLSCPSLAISVSDPNACESNSTVLQLNSRDSATTWQLNSDSSIVTSPIHPKFVRITLPGPARFLSLVEVQVFDVDGTNKALTSAGATASQSSTFRWGGSGPECVASLAIDGFTNQDRSRVCNGMTHTVGEQNPWWMVDMKSPVTINKVVIYTRNEACCAKRTSNAIVELLDEYGNVVGKVADIGPVSPQNARIELPRTQFVPTDCSKKAIDIKTTGTLTVSSGTSLILSDINSTFSSYQKWEMRNSQHTILSGPHYFVQYSTGLAMSLADDSCAMGTGLNVHAFGYDDTKQQFYIGSGGIIYSVRCPGLVVSAGGGVGATVTLQTATGEDSNKWNFISDGLIKNMQYKEAALSFDGTNIVLAQIVEKTSRWEKVNTRLLPTNEAQSNNGWNQGWNVEFVEPSNGSLSSLTLPCLLQGDSPLRDGASFGGITIV